MTGSNTWNGTRGARRFAPAHFVGYQQYLEAVDSAVTGAGKSENQRCVILVSAIFMLTDVCHTRRVSEKCGRRDVELEPGSGSGEITPPLLRFPVNLTQ